MGCRAAAGAEPGATAVVVYNSNLPESKAVAEHYAETRRVPSDQLFGFDLPATEAISRRDFREKLQRPLLARLENAKLITFPADPPRNGFAPENAEIRPITATIRYAVLCYGVPLKIQADPTLTEEGMDKLKAELRRNDAAVDSELSLLPVSRSNPRLYGPIPNRAYAATNTAALHPTNGILMVARLDGPSVSVANGLVDKALEAERDGLWGRAYFDARGLTNGPYKLGDDWIRACAELTRRMGVETVLDNRPETFTGAFPMSHVGLYAGWYDGNVSGPFARKKVEFMPGAIAYHLHSFSAATLRSTSSYWVGPLLDRGVTATFGCVEEPYLEGTPDVAAFLSRLVLLGFTFGEAAYAAQGSLSWQTTVVGDPLYRPFGRQPPQMHADLTERHSRLVEWSLLRAINQNMAGGEPAAKYITFLQQIAETRTSAVLREKLGDLLAASALPDEAVLSYQAALDLGPSPQQQLRLMLSLARTLELSAHSDGEYAALRRIAKTFPDYAGLSEIYGKLIVLAERLGKADEKEQLQKALERLPTARN